jgi:hypothetical protein
VERFNDDTITPKLAATSMSKNPEERWNGISQALAENIGRKKTYSFTPGLLFDDENLKFWVQKVVSAGWR